MEKKQKKQKHYTPPVITKKERFKTLFGDALFFTLGSICYAISVNMFVSPNDIAPGGVTGLAVIANHLIGVPIGITMIVMNIPLFVLAVIFIGKKFLLKTIVATIMTSGFIDLLAPFLPEYSGDRLLASLFGGLLSGLALGLVFIRGATSGGTDILGKLLQKALPHLPMGTLVLILDMAVVLIAGLVYRSIEGMLYSIIVFFISSRVINYLLYGTGNGKMLMVVTKHADEMATAIIAEAHRGVTILPVQGAYSKEEKQMLLCVVRANEVAKVQKIIRRYEENPFIIITEAGEVLGLGFKSHS
ncbi:MAG: YitT family protein [Oscillospiraceae bacterium]|jgi:uncharacterized membrane-anchored protein YitT (DUF2179 family)|nr:YitT family protein [Oscillospiraceae bacterium]